MWSITKVLFILFATKMTLNSGVFRYTPSYLHGTSMYTLNPKDRTQCMRACYEEDECVFVTYNENSNHCKLYRQGDSAVSDGFALAREERDDSCVTEVAGVDISFQKIPYQENRTKLQCNNSTRPDSTLIQHYDRFRHRLFLDNSTIRSNWDWSIGKFRLNYRRLFFGEVYNTSGYYFYNAYAFADYCITPKGECLGVQEIQEYVDEEGKFFYDEPGREDMTDSGLDQTFFIVGKEIIIKQ